MKTGWGSYVIPWKILDMILNWCKLNTGVNKPLENLVAFFRLYSINRREKEWITE